jgi:hypothetical protein
MRQDGIHDDLNEPRRNLKAVPGGIRKCHKKTTKFNNFLMIGYRKIPEKGAYALKMWLCKPTHFLKTPAWGILFLVASRNI